MRIFGRAAGAIALALAMSGVAPAQAQDVLQCVPYARAISGIAIRGDAWTWWGQAQGRYARGYEPRPGAVIALANTDVMPLGHVAVVSRIVDDRHILLRHANWSGPGLIERDVLAVDSSPAGDWSQVRIWWGQSQQMGARDNPVNGFIYPEAARDEAILSDEPIRVAEAVRPRLAVDPSLFGGTQANALSLGEPEQQLAMIGREAVPQRLR